MHVRANKVRRHELVLNKTIKVGAPEDPYCQHFRVRRNSAAQIFQRLRAEEAYTGGISILTDYVRRVRPVRAPAFLTLVFAPGGLGPGFLPPKLLVISETLLHDTLRDCNFEGRRISHIPSKTDFD